METVNENISYPLKIEGYYIWWQCLGPNPKRQYLSSSEKTAPSRQEGDSSDKVCKKEKVI